MYRYEDAFVLGQMKDPRQGHYSLNLWTECNPRFEFASKQDREFSQVKYNTSQCPGLYCKAIYILFSSDHFTLDQTHDSRQEANFLLLPSFSWTILPTMYSIVTLTSKHSATPHEKKVGISITLVLVAVPSARRKGRYWCGWISLEPWSEGVNTMFNSPIWNLSCNADDDDAQ